MLGETQLEFPLVSPPHLGPGGKVHEGKDTDTFSIPALI